MFVVIAHSTLTTIVTAWLLLFLGDFLSTFCYHVPEHVFGRLHLRTHHSVKKNFRHYAILILDFTVLLDGFLGALPYLLIAAGLWQFSPDGVMLGLLLGQLHVWWRHTTVMGWQLPQSLKGFCQFYGITTPEQHWRHHRNINIGYGDIFTIFDLPARAWLVLLRWLRLKLLYSPLHLG
uniref:Fatty acid hydroxylase n=1 Tax=Cyanothece sp. (strain PCC 7425 / ATCC 29141) TaxID=395961 RepID=B8HKU3_CYAP4